MWTQRFLLSKLFLADFVTSTYIICHFRLSVRVQTGLFHLHWAVCVVDPMLCRQGLCALEAHHDWFYQDGLVSLESTGFCMGVDCYHWFYLDWLRAAEEMDRLDEEMRETIRRLWSVQGRKMLDLLMPSIDGQYFTVLHSRRRTSIYSLWFALKRHCFNSSLGFCSCNTNLKNGRIVIFNLSVLICLWFNDSMPVEGLANAGTLLVAFTVILSACGRSKVWLMRVFC